MGRPEDVAAAVVALCDPGLDYVTGQVLPVDGGLSAGRYGIPTQANEGDHDA
jgi:NAD(P)-dependent dehydrogenase (short-subunit alcohol dehydrogenase family)